MGMVGLVLIFLGGMALAAVVVSALLGWFTGSLVRRSSQTAVVGCWLVGALFSGGVIYSFLHQYNLLDDKFTSGIAGSALVGALLLHGLMFAISVTRTTIRAR
jgi:hypothetical protein